MQAAVLSSFTHSSVSIDIVSQKNFPHGCDNLAVTFEKFTGKLLLCLSRSHRLFLLLVKGVGPAGCNELLYCGESLHNEAICQEMLSPILGTAPIPLREVREAEGGQNRRQKEAFMECSCLVTRSHNGQLIQNVGRNEGFQALFDMRIHHVLDSVEKLSFLIERQVVVLMDHGYPDQTLLGLGGQFRDGVLEEKL